MTTQVFVWLVTAFGVTQILTFSKLFEPLRNWLGSKEGFVPWVLSEILNCVMCCATWVGLGMSFLWSPTIHCHLASNWISWFLDGMFASGGVWIVNTVVSHFDED